MMKTKLIALLVVISALLVSVYAQECYRVINLYKNGELIQKYKVSELDSIKFDSECKFSVSVSSAEGGTVSISSSDVIGGEKVTLNATPNRGYNFENWTVDGVVVSTENPYTATITANTEFVANFEIDPYNAPYVDLALPSGIKWATCNIGAITPEEVGDYVAWGEIEPSNYYAWNRYSFCNQILYEYNEYPMMTKYCTISNQGEVDDKTTLELSDDIAHAKLGGDWRMPTKAEQEELRDTTNCIWTWTTQNGVNGYKVTSVKNGNYIFLPADGYCFTNNHYVYGTEAYYWSSSLDADNNYNAYAMHFDSGNIECLSIYRYLGMSVRPVYGSPIPKPTPIVYTVSVSAADGGVAEVSATEANEGEDVTLTATPKEGYNFVNWTVNGREVSTENPYTATIVENTEFIANFEEFNPEYVDLGLPSGMKWATCNIGATLPEEYGDYFSWGETETKTIYSWSTYKWCNGSSNTMTKYCTNSLYGMVDNKKTLELADDAAQANWGNNWRMPTKVEFDELRDSVNCTWTWVEKNGVNGYEVTSKVNGNSIFFPVAGYRENLSLNNNDINGCYWTSSLDAEYSNAAYYLSFGLTYFDTYNSNRFGGRSVRAVYDTLISAPVIYSVSVSKTKGGDAQSSVTEVAKDEEVTLTATPYERCTFVGWSVNGEIVSAENPYTTTLTENTEFVANFEFIPQYVDLGLPSGIKWADCNVGATIPEGFGDYFAWGESYPQTEYNWSTYKYCEGASSTLTKYCNNSSYGMVDNKTSLELSDDAAHLNWGGKWRTPTFEEQEELQNNCTWNWTTKNGVKGYEVISKVNGNSIFLPASGYRYNSESNYVGNYGYYMANEFNPQGCYSTSFMYFASFAVDWETLSRCCGLSVRPVYDASMPEIYEVSVSATEGGTAEVSSIQVAEGGEVTLTATPSVGYEFVNWTLNGEAVSFDNPYTVTITSDIEYVANFKLFVPDYVDLGLPSGIKWAECNVGAYTPEEYGDYFAWGETDSKDIYRWNTYKYCNGTYDSQTKYCVSPIEGVVDNKTELEPGDDAAQVNWGGNWRMPTIAELEELRDPSNCTWTLTSQNGVSGCKITSNVNGNSIFLPSAGFRSDNFFHEVGSVGYYWTGSLGVDISSGTGSSSMSFGFQFYWGKIAKIYYARYIGFPVRAVCP